MNIKDIYLLCVRCMTYNHSEYIKDALDGFCMQRTSFPFYAVVFDDASTDGEQEVIKSYMEHYFELSEDSGCKQWETEEAVFVFARHKENENCHFLVVYLKKNLYKTTRKDDLIKEWCVAKYIALCEGDDYWTDPLKLQKQVDFLENNAEYAACFHRCSIFYESENRMTDKDQFDGIIQKGQNGLDLAGGVGVLPQLLTMVYRKEVLERSEWYYKLNVRSQYDQTMIFAIGELGRIWVLNDNMGVYRRHKGGVATSLSKKQAAEKMYLTWHDVYGVHPNEETKAMYSNSLKQYMYFLMKNGWNESE